ncbi:Rft-1-domain-containing protein [Lactarius akahatsu]|uniref:Man(5)GlcNAc(2)-PP-dolichol translocation protein RFT1 n=1 Tax=Lactarius akahatsu TaxID=416441 RepID=A0AAD4LDC8_9AGAM|nr:Rft-1-domain-containing protein [Lactarius akahatsu]
MRLATPQTFGTATVQFELLLSTTVFLSREGVRTALLRQRKSVPPDFARNIALLPAYVGTPIAVALAVLLSIYVFAAALELAAEPLYICVDVSVHAEGAAVFSKTLITFLGLVFAPPAWALVAFTAVTGCLRPRHIRGLLEILWVVNTHFLTGDKLLISRLSPRADQGSYAIASNYGSLIVIARVVFRPIEETSRIFFKFLSSPSSSSSENDQEALQTAVELLSILLLLFDPSYLPLATALVLPPRYQQTSAPRILCAFRFYLPAMTYNGVLKAFLSRPYARLRTYAPRAAWWPQPPLRSSQPRSSGTTPQAWPCARWGRRATPPALRARNLAFAAAAVCTRWSADAHADVRVLLRTQRWHVALGGGCLGVCLVVCYVLEWRQFSRTILVLRSWK